MFDIRAITCQSRPDKLTRLLLRACVALIDTWWPISGLLCRQLMHRVLFSNTKASIYYLYSLLFSTAKRFLFTWGAFWWNIRAGRSRDWRRRSRRRRSRQSFESKFSCLFLRALLKTYHLVSFYRPIISTSVKFLHLIKTCLILIAYKTAISNWIFEWWYV